MAATRVDTGTHRGPGNRVTHREIGTPHCKLLANAKMLIQVEGNPIPFEVVPRFPAGQNDRPAYGVGAVQGRSRATNQIHGLMLSVSMLSLP